MASAAASTRNSITHWRIPCFYTLSCYHPLAMSECRCRALKLSLSQACFWAPKMRPILVTKTRPRSLRQTLEAPNLGPQFWDQEKSCCGALLGPRLARRANLKFLRLTLPFVFSKLLARALSHTHGGFAMARPQIAPFLAPKTMVNTVVMLHHGADAAAQLHVQMPNQESAQSSGK